MTEDQSLKGLLTATEAAAYMKMSLNQFKHHLTREGAPKAVLVGNGNHKFYREADLKTWKPRRMRKS